MESSWRKGGGVSGERSFLHTTKAFRYERSVDGSGHGREDLDTGRLVGAAHI